jgi:branched-chain amino acid aminotransferase
LWLYGPGIVQTHHLKINISKLSLVSNVDHVITEVGAMNIFIVLDKGDGHKELVTPPLDGGIILPGFYHLISYNNTLDLPCMLHF